MVQTKQQAGSACQQIVLRPNTSLTWRQAAVSFVGISIIPLIVALFFASRGGWLILPICAAELLFLGYGLWSSLREGSVCEVITITEYRVRIEKGRYKPEQRFDFQRCWATINLTRSPLRGHPSRLAIGSHGRQVEIGRFLLESERRKLALELGKALV